MRRVLAASTLVVFLAAQAPPAVAHTDLVSVSPADGSRVSDWPSELVLAFSEPVDPSLSAVTVAIGRQDGARIPVGRGDEDFEIVGDLRSLEQAQAASSLRVRVRVRYRITSADGHPIAGSYAFTVESERSATRGAGPDGGADPLAPSTPPVTDEANSGSLAALWLALGALALVLVSALAAVRRLRTGPTGVEGRP